MFFLELPSWILIDVTFWRCPGAIDLKWQAEIAARDESFESMQKELAKAQNALTSRAVCAVGFFSVAILRLPAWCASSFGGSALHMINLCYIVLGSFWGYQVSG